MIENGIDHSGLVTLDKSSGNVSIFGNHDTRWHILPMHQFVSPRPQSCAQDGIDALARTAFRQSLVDQRIKLALLAHDAGHHVTEERSLGRQVLRPLSLTPDPMTLAISTNILEDAC